jgi:hypothetical protein
MAAPPSARKGQMDTRILELALEGLQARKTALEAEIQSLKAELSGGTIPKIAGWAAGKRRPRSAAQRKAHSKRMKVIWAVRKAKAAKPRITKKLASATQKPGKSATANIARSAKMKAYWAKKRLGKKG